MMQVCGICNRNENNKTRKRPKPRNQCKQNIKKIHNKNDGMCALHCDLLCNIINWLGQNYRYYILWLIFIKVFFFSIKSCFNHQNRGASRRISIFLYWFFVHGWNDILEFNLSEMDSLQFDALEYQSVNSKYILKLMIFVSTRSETWLV